MNPDLIASHGHTIFHEPSQGFSFQLGSAAHIAAACGLPCASDFRNTDMAHGGQGAPLAPVSDFDLFPEYDVCVNLGGIANISYTDEDGQRLGYDITVCNLILNHLSIAFGEAYDKDGLFGKGGNLDSSLLLDLESIDYYKHRGAKSIDKVWFYNHILKSLSSIEDQCTSLYSYKDDSCAYEKAGQTIKERQEQVFSATFKNTSKKFDSSDEI